MLKLINAKFEHLHQTKDLPSNLSTFYKTEDLATRIPA